MLTLQTKTVSLHSINSAIHTYTVFFLDTLSFFKFSIPCGKVTKNVKLLLLYFFKPLNFAVLPLVLPSMQTLFWLLRNLPIVCLVATLTEAVSGAYNPERTTSKRSCHSVFTNKLIFRLILARIKTIA